MIKESVINEKKIKIKSASRGVWEIWRLKRSQKSHFSNFRRVDVKAKSVQCKSCRVWTINSTTSVCSHYDLNVFEKNANNGLFSCFVVFHFNKNLSNAILTKLRENRLFCAWNNFFCWNNQEISEILMFFRFKTLFSNSIRKNIVQSSAGAHCFRFDIYTY